MHQKSLELIYFWETKYFSRFLRKKNNKTDLKILKFLLNEILEMQINYKQTLIIL